MKIRRLLLDVDKSIEAPSVLEIASIIDAVQGVDAVNVTVTEIDVETVGMEITVEGEDIDYAGLESAITKAGAALHSIDEVVAGTHTVERVRRAR
jgi:uncharacterized protein